MQKSDTKDSHVEAPSLLTANKARESLKKLDGWQLTDDHKMIYREFILQDFMTAIDLIDRIALIAQDEKHHPDIHLTQCRNLRVALTTHDVGGLSQKDFTVALKIKDLPILFHQHNNGVVIDQRSQSKKQAGKEEAVKKNNPIPKPRYEQKNVQPKKRKIISPVLKKEKNVKTHASSMQGRAN